MLSILLLITSLWLPLHYHANEHPTADQLRPYKIVAGWVDQYPNTKPKGQLWYPYLKGTRTNEKNLPDSWYLKNKDGQRVRDAVSSRLFVMNPNDPGWENHVNNDCKQIRSQLSLANGCFVDGMGDAGFARMDSRPIDPSTNLPMDLDTWHDGITTLSHSVDGKIILNNVGNGTNIDRYPHNSDTIFASEGFCFNINTRLTFFQQMDLLKNYPVLETGRGGGDQRSCLAAFLLGKSKGDRFFDATSALDLQPRLFRKRLGRPTDEIHRQWPGVFARNFAKGKVVFNVTNNPKTINFKKPYKLQGKLIRSLYLSGHQGEILRLSR